MSTSRKTSIRAVMPADPETIESMMKVGQEAASKQMESTMRATAEQMEKASQRMMQTGEEMANLSRETMEAMVQATSILAKGCEEMGRNLMSWSQNALEQSMTAGKQMLGVKTMREMVDLQTEYMRSWLDNSMAETTRMTEISARTTNQALEPLTQSMNSAVERMTQVSKEAA